MSAEIDRGSYPKDVARLLARHAPGLLGAAFVAALALAPAAALAGEPSTGPGVSGSWLSQVQQGIASEEYQVTWQTETALPDLDAAWQAPNRSHGLRTYFTAAGIRVVPRQDAAPSWEWGLAWVGYGRGGMSWAVPAARLCSTRLPSSGAGRSRASRNSSARSLRAAGAAWPRSGSFTWTWRSRGRSAPSSRKTASPSTSRRPGARA
ncbi:MAG: hypothetical protein MUF27_17860, partial [Acidobacteria bacterium]|nr:hypothetical protein [Acidobacteriota bacterium]